MGCLNPPVPIAKAYAECMLKVDPACQLNFRPQVAIDHKSSNTDSKAQSNDLSRDCSVKLSEFIIALLLDKVCASGNEEVDTDHITNDTLQ